MDAIRQDRRIHLFLQDGGQLRIELEDLNLTVNADLADNLRAAPEADFVAPLERCALALGSVLVVRSRREQDDALLRLPRPGDEFAQVPLVVGQRLFPGTIQVAVGQSLAIGVSSDVVHSEHDRDRVGIFGEDVVVEARKPAFRRLAAKSAVDDLDLLLRTSQLMQELQKADVQPAMGDRVSEHGDPLARAQRKTKQYRRNQQSCSHFTTFLTSMYKSSPRQPSANELGSDIPPSPQARRSSAIRSRS